MVFGHAAMIARRRKDSRPLVKPGFCFEGPAMSPQYAYMDECQGKWTRIVAKADRVEFRPTGTYLRGKIAGVLVVAVSCYFLCESPAFSGWIGRLALAFIVAILASVLTRTLAMSPPAIVVFDMDVDPMPNSPPSELYVRAHDVNRVIVRKNGGNAADAGVFAQLYLVVDGANEALLLHQRGRRRCGDIREIGAQLAQRWHVALIDELAEELGSERR